MGRANIVAFDDEHAGLDGRVEGVRIGKRHELSHAHGRAEGDREQHASYGWGQAGHACAEQVLDGGGNGKVLPGRGQAVLPERARRSEGEERIAERRLVQAAKHMPREAQAEALGEDVPDRSEARRRSARAREALLERALEPRTARPGAARAGTPRARPRAGGPQRPGRPRRAGRATGRRRPPQGAGDRPPASALSAERDRAGPPAAARSARRGRARSRGRAAAAGAAARASSVPTASNRSMSVANESVVSAPVARAGAALRVRGRRRRPTASTCRCRGRP